jgi:ATPase family associated with various cellular activities (AAA)
VNAAKDSSRYFHRNAGAVDSLKEIARWRLMQEVVSIRSRIRAGSLPEAVSQSTAPGSMPEIATDTYGLKSLSLSYMTMLLDSEDCSAEARYLRSHGAIGPAGPAPAASLQRYIDNPSEEDRLMLEIARELSLSHVELLVLSLAMAIETDLMCGRAIAHLQSPLGGSRPSLGLLAAAFSGFEERGPLIAAILDGPAVRSGLLQISADGAPLVERSVSVPVPLFLALQGTRTGGFEGRWPGTVLDASGLGDVPLPPSALAGARRQAQELASGSRTVLTLRTGSPAEGRALASEISRLLGRRALFIEESHGREFPALSGLAPWLILKQLLPVFCIDLGPGERKSLPALPLYYGPQLVICGREGSVEFNGDSVPSWSIDTAPREERALLWKAAIGSGPVAKEVSTHRHGSGRIAQLGRMARRNSLLDGRGEPELRDVLAAAWTSEGTGLETLAQPMAEQIADEALVITPGLRKELDRLFLRCRGREGLVDGLGPSASAKYRNGVRALFTGPSGTGKTLAAGWLATRLGLPLYRVDLAAVTSKYIGETEKNLAQLLARAEHAEVILLFDEADSMFGKRTDVKDSNDRFANAQTNYLLQRIENFDGIVLLTSNSRSRFDPAFFRRLDAIVEFPVPGPAERRSLWQSHLGRSHRMSDGELNQLSAAADLLGGNIRNAVLTASLLARNSADQIDYRYILEALKDEYLKLGRQVPSELSRR